MAESLVVSAIGKLGYEIIKEFGLLFGVKRDLKILENTFLTIKDVLGDAESRPITENEPLYKWLAKLKNAAYDTEDLLDYIQMEIERRKLEIHGHMIRGVIEFFSRSNPIIFRLKISHKIKEMRERIDEISTERLKFHLKKKDGRDRKMEVEERETWSTPDETNIRGRDDDIERIVSILMETNNEADVLILSIVGMGGLGKTTLAQLVYNDERVKRNEQFELRSWVYVSAVFDPKKIARDAISSVNGQSCDHDSLNSIGNQLKNLLKEKKFLLVLDDVWNENSDVWEKLKPMLNVGRRGSSIIVTTRSKKVASIMGNTTPYNLKKLSDDDSWKLFKQRALGEKSEEENSRLVEIGKEIVKKCGGIPLAANSLGSIMRFKKEEEDWLAVRDNDIWKVTEEGGRILASLKLSYNHLSPPVKQCFAYCFLFPKGYEFVKDTLISQWIAQDFVRSIHGSLQMESIAKTYFNDLLQMSFLQDLKDDIYSGSVTCKMHDLVHDLAGSVAGDDVLVEEVEKSVTSLTKSCRYVAMIGNNSSTKVYANSLKKVRALHFFYNSEEYESREFSSSILSSAKCLRTLDLSDGRIKSLPKLNNLRYLCASIADVEMLPKYICGIRNLQCLYLSDCESLRTIPKSIGDLHNLRNLKLIGCGSELQSFPDSFANLQCLLSLELSNGRMELLPIKSFAGLQNLRSINLSHCYGLMKLPNSIGDAKNLRSLNMERCKSLQALPESMSNLTQLETLNVKDCESLQELPKGLGNLGNLKHLNLRRCEVLKELPESIGNAKNLRILNMEYCYHLQTLPESMSNLTQLESLNIRCCGRLQELPKGLGNMRNLKHVNNEGCYSLRGMPRDMRQLLNLRTLDSFVVSKQEDSGFSSIGELEHLNHIEGALTLTHLDRVRAPSDAMKAKLKEKRKLNMCSLLWVEVSREGHDDAGVLKCLQPPPSIKDLKIIGYPGSKNPSWLASASLPNLSRLILRDVKQIDRLPRLEQFSSLEYLWIRGMHGIRLMDAATLFPSLKKLWLLDNPNLEEWTTTTAEEETLFPRLQELRIARCPKLKGPPWIASVEYLSISSSSEEWLSEKSLPQAAFSYRVRRLEIINCGASTQWTGLRHLASSLQNLSICDCRELRCLPESIRHLASLQKLHLWDCENLSEIPQWVGELQSLRLLSISRCPGLKERCERERGEDWHKISHIPEIDIR